MDLLGIAVNLFLTAINPDVQRCLKALAWELEYGASRARGAPTRNH